MVKYTLDVWDRTDPDSRLEFLNQLEQFLHGLLREEIINEYSLSTPNNVVILFEREAEA